MRPPYFPGTGLYDSFVPAGMPIFGTFVADAAWVVLVVGLVPGLAVDAPLSPRSQPMTAPANNNSTEAITGRVVMVFRGRKLHVNRRRVTSGPSLPSSCFLAASVADARLDFGGVALRVKHVAQPVAHEVQAQQRDREQHAREHEHPP